MAFPKKDHILKNIVDFWFYFYHSIKEEVVHVSEHQISHREANLRKNIESNSVTSLSSFKFLV